MKVAVVGANGQLGSDLVKVLSGNCIPLTHAEIEVKNSSNCLKVLEGHKPEIVINCAAYVRVDNAEDDAEESFAINAVGAKNVATACEKINAVNVYISTDYVFDGEKKSYYTEDDIPDPINTYGISKLAGEFFTRLAEKHYVFRVASLFGVAGASGKGGNFIETMIKKAKNNEEIKVVDDMIMSPTYTRDAAKMIKDIIEKKLPYGTYHITNSGSCSWSEFAGEIFNILGLKASIFPIKTAGLNMKARRPKFSALTSVRLKGYGLKMQDWRSALKDYLKEKGYL